MYFKFETYKNKKIHINKNLAKLIYTKRAKTKKKQKKMQ